MNELLDKLASLCGILPEYYDIWGKRHETSPETKIKILRAMGHDAENEEAIKNAIRAKSAPLLLDSAIVFNLKKPESMVVPVNLPYTAEAVFELSLKGESDKVEKLSFEAAPSEINNFEGVQYGRYLLGPERLSLTEPGYYEASLKAEFGGKSRTGSIRVIVSPGAAYLPDEFDRGEFNRAWGVTASLHSLRSERNWGIGDFTDLGGLIDWVAGLGGDFVGILPLHALPLPKGISPYSPISRLYRNFIYLDLEEVQEFETVKGKIPLDEIKRLRETEFVEYEGVYRIKMDALEKMFRTFYSVEYERDTPRARRFKKYFEKEREEFTHFAAFMALSEKFEGGWMDWPEPYRDPKAPAVSSFIEENMERVLFYAYIQWLIDEELSALSIGCGKNGMRAGIYSDLAVGSLGGGADAWLYREDFAFGADVGAPPDEFNINGQNWGFPPLRPDKLKERGYDIFIKTIRKNLEHCGVLRIDHAPGLGRLFWVPEGMKPSEGAYVEYPFGDLLGIIALESVRQKALIVAEDLGTVPDEVRKGLAEYNMLSYRLFYYERRYPDPALRSPLEYPERALAAITTHDLPTIYGYWQGQDIRVKKELSIYPSRELYEKDSAARERDMKLIMEALKKERLLPEDFTLPEEMTEELMLAVYAYLAKSPALLVAVSLDDWLKSPHQQNMPGTTNQCPNWRRKTPLAVEEFTREGDALARLFKKEKRGR